MGTSIVWHGLVLECRRSEHDSLAIALTMAFTLYAVPAHGPFLSTLDTTFSTCQTASLGPFSGELGFQRGFRRGGICSSVHLRIIVAALFAPGIALHAVYVVKKRAQGLSIMSRYY